MNRVHTYPITNEEKTKELNIIQDALYNNEYNNKNINIRHPRNKKHNKKNISQQHQTTKCVTFTYYGKENKRNLKTFRKNKY
jgi:hypothetical protein